MRAGTVVLSLLVVASLGGCMEVGQGGDGGSEQRAPDQDPTAVPSASPTFTPQPIPGHAPMDACEEASADCFVFVWIDGTETATAIDGPEHVPWRGQGAYCGHRDPGSPAFAHEVRLDDERIVHRAGSELAPTEVLFAFDHFAPAADCGLAFALVSDPVGILPVEMGRGGVHAFAWDDGEVTVDHRHAVPTGHQMAFPYNVTETEGDWTVRHEGVFEVRNLGLWPASSLVPYGEGSG